MKRKQMQLADSRLVLPSELSSYKALWPLSQTRSADDPATPDDLSRRHLLFGAVSKVARRGIKQPCPGLWIPAVHDHPGQPADVGLSLISGRVPRCCGNLEASRQYCPLDVAGGAHGPTPSRCANSRSCTGTAAISSLRVIETPSFRTLNERCL